MPGRQAKIITPLTLQRMLGYARRSTLPIRNRVIILLSVKAGLRACEIAGLDWTMVLNERGLIDDAVVIHDEIAKMGSGRRISMHPDLQQALRALKRDADPIGPVIRSARGGRMQANSIVNWFVQLFTELGLQGCSSHSGRRTFITAAARTAHRAGCTYGTFNCSPAINRSRQRSGTSTALPRGRDGSYP